MMERRSHGGMWMRGDTIARGSYSTVSVAITNESPSHLPPLMAVKSAAASRSVALQKEREILTRIGGCPYIVRCYGDELTTENDGELTYNVLLEYASGGTLASRIENSPDGLPEDEVRRYTRSILQGLHFLHDRGYVHCDIKPQNILLVLPKSSSVETGSNDYIAKIADFGSTRNIRKEQRKRKNDCRCSSLRGTPLYMSPESVAHNEQEAPSDLWALGCVVSEMISGKPAWNCRSDMDIDELFSLIGSSDELPETPSKMSKEGKDFLKRCFVRTSMFRWTAAMLLRHPFVSDVSDYTKEAVQQTPAPGFPTDTKVQLSRSNVKNSAVGHQKRRRVTGPDEPSTGNGRLKPVSEAPIVTRD